MTSTYYTPTIEDFHVGFHFEHEDINTGRWDKHIFEETYSDYLFMVKMDLEDGLFRVKQLDQLDIESLGWQQKKDYGNDYFLEDYCLANVPTFKGSLISGYTWIIEKDKEILYTGNIKSINELSSLMKMLKIKK